MSADTIIPGPPRLDNLDPNDPSSIITVVTALHKYLSTFHQAAVGEAKLLNPSFQADAGVFDAAHLPDPALTSIAKAQDTANRAFETASAAAPSGAASTAQAAADAAQTTANSALALATSLVPQTLTISGAATTGTYTFDNPHPDNLYPVRLEPVSFTDDGIASPPGGAFIPTVTSKTVNDFEITLGAAPGAGCSVTFQLILRL